MNLIQFWNKTQKLKKWVFFLLIVSSLICAAESDPRITESGLFCGNATAPQGVNIVMNFRDGMQGLSQVITDRLFGTFEINGTNPFFTLSQCHRDLTPTDCLLCFAAARTRLPRCVPAVGGAVFLDGCFLRYDNYSFYQESVSSSRYHAVNCSADDAVRLVGFRASVRFAVGNASQIAVSSDGYGVYGFRGVYVLAQCWESVPRDGCRRCLESAAAAVNGCVPKRDGRGMNSGCYLRFSTERFYDNRTGSSGGSGSSRSRRRVILAIVLATLAFLMLSAVAAYAIYTKIIKIRRDRGHVGRMLMSFNRSGLAFKYETLEEATNFFSPQRKIGEGGNGSVFIGTLPNGTTVAVKRLIFNTRQWVDDFFNEVNLISRIDHKNLVKLLGCSIEGPESLLVYEYVVNKSLDQFLFDGNRTEVLSWRQRMHIIIGTAEGLAYLHGGSEVRIIHRDIKSSNVLLDRDLNAKIADFGLARCLGPDISHLSTGVAGTLGYMAPEYLVRGQLTEKADVYSFGVLVLEIACGKRNSAFSKDAGSLLQMVWRHYKSKTLAEAVDPRIRDKTSAEEASVVLQIGLLCTQASVALRPSMEEVVRLLNQDNPEVPEPSQPPFMNASLLNPASSSGSSGTNNSLMSAARRLIQSSSTFEIPSSTAGESTTIDEEAAMRRLVKQ